MKHSMKFSTTASSVALLFAISACGTETAAPAQEAPIGDQAEVLPTPAPTTAAVEENGDSPAFDRALELLPSAHFDYTPQQEADITLASSTLISECLKDAGHSVSVEVLGAVSVADVEASWATAVHGIEFADEARISEEGYTYWQSGDRVTDQSDNIDDDAYKTLNDPGGCRDQAYAVLGVDEVGVLALDVPEEVIQFERDTFSSIKTGPDLKAQWSAWSECLDKAGYADVRPDSPLPETDPGNKRAIADAQCRDASGVRQGILDVHREAVSIAMTEFRTLVSSGAAQRDQEAAAARTVLGERSLATQS